jgi:hypothetical protein
LFLALLFIVVLVAGFSVSSSPLMCGYRNTMIEEAREKEALLKMHKVEQACKSYYATTGTWPESLNLLIEDSPEGAILTGGRFSITSPWGTPFQIEVRAEGDGREQVVITTTDPKGKVLRWPSK